MEEKEMSLEQKVARMLELEERIDAYNKQVKAKLEPFTLELSALKKAVIAEFQDKQIEMAENGGDFNGMAINGKMVKLKAKSSFHKLDFTGVRALRAIVEPLFEEGYWESMTEPSSVQQNKILEDVEKLYGIEKLDELEPIIGKPYTIFSLSITKAK